MGVEGFVNNNQREGKDKIGVEGDNNLLVRVGEMMKKQGWKEGDRNRQGKLKNQDRSWVGKTSNSRNWPGQGDSWNHSHRIYYHHIHREGWLTDQNCRGSWKGCCNNPKRMEKIGWAWMGNYNRGCDWDGPGMMN